MGRTQIPQHKNSGRIPVNSYLVKGITVNVIGIAFHRRSTLWNKNFSFPVTEETVRTAAYHSWNTFVYTVRMSRTKMRIIAAEFAITRNVAVTRWINSQKIIKLRCGVFFISTAFLKIIAELK